jgi:hypothetical protein
VAPDILAYLKLNFCNERRPLRPVAPLAWQRPGRIRDAESIQPQLKAQLGQCEFKNEVKINAKILELLAKLKPLVMRLQ